MGRIQQMRMERAKRAFKEEMFPRDQSRSFYVDHAGNAIGFAIERADGSVLYYDAEAGHYKPNKQNFEIRPEDGAVNMPPYDYKNGKYVDLLSADPLENIQKYTCFYARYFCGDFDSIITESEYRQLEESEELYAHDTLSYEPIFDGKIYPTLAESSAAQIEAFGFHFNDDRRQVPSRAEQSITGKEKNRHPPLAEKIADASAKTQKGPSPVGQKDFNGREGR